ncbi:MAG: alginate lyase family protein [Gemmatimonadetes bacterium]|nr:alginate lyase family protein [Gemmatimonadota bacterium]
MDLAKLEDDSIISEQLLVESEHEENVDLSVDAGDWRRVNEVRAEVYLPPGANGLLWCRLTSGHRTEGMSEDDGYLFHAIVSPRGGNVWEGWREFRFPAECFYTQGIPSGWHQTRSAALEGPQGSRFRNIRLVEREITPGPRMTDEAFIAALDPEHPGLEMLKDAQDGSLLTEVARYFRSSGFDRELVPSEQEPNADPDQADRVLEGRVLGQDWSAEIDWEANPTGYIEWTLAIHYLLFLRPAIDAFWETGDANYAKGIERYISDWMRRCPVPYGVRAGGYPWGHSLVVAIRPFSTLVDVFRVLCSCPETDDATIIDMLKSIYEHQACLLRFQSFPPSNKTIAEARTIAALGCAFPEFRDAAQWREEGYRRLLDDMRVQVMPDGASYELTPGYQMSIATWFLESFQVARKFNHRIDPELEAGIRSMFDWCVAITRPDFTRPSVSDAGSMDSRYDDSLAHPGRVLDNPAAVWVGTGGREGTPPDYRSIALRDSGYFIMRSGWDRDARYLFFEGGPYGRWHQHEDKLSLEVYAYGTPFIVDPGITSYYTNPWTRFYTTTQAHSTVLVDGRPQARGRNQTIEQWTRSARDSTFWRSDDDSDVAAASYDAPYSDLDAAVRHRRAVIFVKPDYFMVFDELTGEGSHTYEALFHFMPFRLLTDSETGAVRTGRMDAPNLELIPLTRMTPRLVCGQNDPVQGWLAVSGQDVPAPVAIYRRRTRLPFRTGYVIYPFGTDRVTAGITTETVRRANVWSVNVDHADGRRDRVRMDWDDEAGPALLR